MKINYLYQKLPYKLPQGRTIEITSESQKWFTRGDNVLYLPKDGVLYFRSNLKSAYVESFMGFCIDFDVIHNWDKTFTLIDADSYNSVSNVIFNAIKPNTQVVCDIETRNLRFEGNKIISIAMRFDNKATYIIDVQKLGLEITVYFMNELFNYGHWVFHNGAFDVTVMQYFGITNAHCDDDTMLMHYTCINEEKGTKSLKVLGQWWLGADAWAKELHDIRNKMLRKQKIKVKDFDWNMLDKDVLFPYNAMDVHATALLYQIFTQYVIEYRDNAYPMCYKLLLDLIPIYSKIERNGMYIDKAHIGVLQHNLQQQLNAHVEKFNEWIVKDYPEFIGVNINSPTRLLEVFQKISGNIPIESTDKDTRDKLMERFPDNMLIKTVDEYNKVKTYLSTFVTALSGRIESDGRIRANFNLSGTETGRLSSSNPNYQNCPRDKLIKNIFIAEPGNILINIDAKAVELRVLAILTQDEWLHDVYAQGKDLHTETALNIFGADSINSPNWKELRTRAKSVNFGSVYGISVFGLAQDLKIKDWEAKQLLDGFWATKPTARKVVDGWRQLPFKGETFTTFTGRERHFAITDSNVNYVQNASSNFPVQSTAADLVLLVLKSFSDLIKGTVYENTVRIVNTVHDSIVLEIPDNDRGMLEYVCNTLMSLFESVPKKYLGDSIPFSADCEVGYKWGELLEYNEFINQNYIKGDN